VLSNRFKTILLSIVTAVWVGSFVAGVFVHGYKPPEGINAVFTLVIGAVVTSFDRGDKGAK
jgi:Na+/H+ antiporter NhaC